VASKLFLLKYQYFRDDGFLIKLTTKYTAKYIFNYLSHVSEIQPGHLSLLPAVITT